MSRQRDFHMTYLPKSLIRKMKYVVKQREYKSVNGYLEKIITLEVEKDYHLTKKQHEKKGKTSSEA